jgi:hypothetical protein
VLILQNVPVTQVLVMQQDAADHIASKIGD